MIRTTRFLRQSLPLALLSVALLSAILQTTLPVASAEPMYIQNPDLKTLFSFHHGTATYIFGLDPDLEVILSGGNTKRPDDNAANWWIINDAPQTGFRSVVKDAKMSSKYKAVTSFQLNNHPHIFGLHKDVGANIWRINNDAKGFELVKYKGKMSPNHSDVVSFQLKGEPYIFGLHDVGANIWRITEGQKGPTFNLVKYKAKMSPNYNYLTVFYLNEHPYLFGLHSGSVGANIWRIKDDPSKGFDLVMYGAKFPRQYDYVLPFHLGGRPYLLGVVSKNYLRKAADMLEAPPYLERTTSVEVIARTADLFVEWGEGYGCIWEINGPPNSLSIKKVSKSIPISHNYRSVCTFEQAGKVYIFGVHNDHYANIWRVNDDPATGFSLVYYGRTDKTIGP